MAYQPQTYIPQKVNFSNIPQQRDGTGAKDARLVNCFVETLRNGEGQVQQEYVVSRGGLQFQLNTVADPVQQGIYYYEGHMYTVTNNILYKDGVNYKTLAVTFEATGFVEFINSTNQKYLVVLDGAKGYVIDPVAGTITTITDVDFPTPHCTRAVFIDGYLCIAKSGTADIYNSDLDNPAAWTAGNFISAEMYPDTLLGLYKQANYIVAMGSQTIEYFYDAGNPTGTPLARNQAAYHRIGVRDPYSVTTFEEQLIFVGASGVGGTTIYKLDTTRMIEIATAPIRKWLEDINPLALQVATVVRTKGHAFYMLSLYYMDKVRTLVYDLLENIWHEWANYDGTGAFPSRWMTDHPDGTPYFLMENTGLVCNMVPTKATDDTSSTVSNNITCIAISNKVDYGTMNRKFANRFTIVCDVPAPAGATSFSLSWSDDDYQTWSTPRTVIISDTMPSIQQLGAFRRRAWKLTYSQPYPMRFEGAELTVNMGST